MLRFWHWAQVSTKMSSKIDENELIRSNSIEDNKEKMMMSIIRVGVIKKVRKETCCCLATCSRSLVACFRIVSINKVEAFSLLFLVPIIFARWLQEIVVLRLFVWLLKRRRWLVVLLSISLSYVYLSFSFYMLDLWVTL